MFPRHGRGRSSGAARAKDPLAALFQHEVTAAEACPSYHAAPGPMRGGTPAARSASVVRAWSTPKFSDTMLTSNPNCTCAAPADGPQSNMYSAANPCRAPGQEKVSLHVLHLLPKLSDYPPLPVVVETLTHTTRTLHASRCTPFKSSSRVSLSTVLPVAHPHTASHKGGAPGNLELWSVIIKLIFPFHHWPSRKAALPSRPVLG